MTADQPAERVTFGSFVLDANTARFVGSDELASVFGFTPGEVVLTAMMVTAHLHPADQSRWQGGLQRCPETGRPQVVEHRIITADRSERPASTTLTAQRDRGVVVSVTGVVNDLSHRLRTATDVEIGTAVRASAATRSEIDQAKGIIMAAFDIDADQAWHRMDCP